MAPGSQNFLLYSDEEKARQCIVITMEQLKLPTEWAFFGHGNVQHAIGRWNGSHRFWNHSILILEDRDLRHAVAFEYKDSMQR